MSPIPSNTRKEMIQACSRLCQLVGLPRIAGQIYGLLYLSVEAMSLDDMVDLLGISKASASTATRQLLSWGAIRAVWVQGERRDFFEATVDLPTLVECGFNTFVKPRLDSSRKRLDNMTASLEEEFKQGILSEKEYELCHERLSNLSRLQRKMQKWGPHASELL